MSKHKPQYIQKLKDYPGIEDVAFSVYELSKEDDMIDLEYARHEDKDVFFKVFYASREFPFRHGYPSRGRKGFYTGGFKQGTK